MARSNVATLSCLVFAAATAGAVSLIAGAGEKTADDQKQLGNVTAKSFKLVDDRGIVRMECKISGGAVGFELRDEAGVPRLVLSCKDDPTITLLSKKREPLVFIEAAPDPDGHATGSLFVRAPGGSGDIRLVASDVFGPYLGLSKDGAVRGGIECMDGVSSVFLRDKQSKPAWSMKVPEPNKVNTDPSEKK